MFRLNASLLAFIAVFATSSILCYGEDKADGKKKILFFSPSFGFRHSAVTRPLTGELSHSEKAFKEFATKAGYEVFFSQDCKDLDNDGGFKKFDAILVYTTGNPLINRDSLLKWLRAGGALIGTHTATDSYHHASGGEVPMNGAEKAKMMIPDWPEYVRIMGAAFKTHGPGHDPIVIKVLDKENPATSMLGEEWTIGDEIYLFDRFNDKVHVLLTTDTDKTSEKSLKGHKMTKGEPYPVAWTNTEGKGRVFYTSLGHEEAVWDNPVYQQHLLGGIAWALGQDKAK